MASKRRFELSTGDSPGKSKPKLASYEGSSRKSLFKETAETSVHCKKERPVPWTKQETSMLVQYNCLYWKDAWNDKWPTTKDSKFWDGCAQAINNSCKSQRTGNCEINQFNLFQFVIANNSISLKVKTKFLSLH